jgi:predicted dienelactone hydrolase
VTLTRFAILVAATVAAAAAPSSATAFEVGHRVEMLSVAGSACPPPGPACDRPVKVHLWYPADSRGFADAPRTAYVSALRGKALPEPFLPLSWEVRSELARETASIDARGPRLPVIVFSHGSTNDPIDYAFTLERIAAEGFVIAAPYHVNNTQDDARIDFVNNLTPLAPTFPTCSDGRAWRLATPAAQCSRPNVPASMQERVRDVSSILDALPAWFGDRVDVDRAGLMGHSRGTLTALTAAGGSGAWGIAPEPRVKAIMGMAIGAMGLTTQVNLADVKVPAVLVAGGKDTNSRQVVSEIAFDAITSPDKLFVGIPNATHRSFDSTYCAQLQSAGAAFDADHDGFVTKTEAANAGPRLDRHTVDLIGASAPGGLSGKAVHYCADRYFAGPVDIRQVVAAADNSEYECSDETTCALVPPTNPDLNVCETSTIPCTGLDTDEVKEGMTQIAVAFFGSALKRSGKDGIHFTRYLAPKWLTSHMPMVGEAEAFAGPDSICPPGQGVVCSE